MNLQELKTTLFSLTVKQLKDICYNTRNWGVYHSHTAYPGYSKCKNKKELVELIFKKQEDLMKPDGFYYENDGSQWSYEVSYYDFKIKNDQIIPEKLFSTIYRKIKK